MNSNRIMDKEKVKKERARKAVALAMQSKWEEAVALNRAIVKDFPEDLEAYNRLGKALSELGRNREAKDAFQRALEISPHNGIAKKNLDRLVRLGDEEAPRPSVTTANAAPRVFIEESGKAGMTSLVNLAPPQALLKLAPGHELQLQIESNKLLVNNASGEYVGRVEPKLSSRLIRLVSGGNKYEAAVTHASEQELAIIIRETYKHPSQANIVSFPSRGGADYRVYVPSPVLGYEEGDVEPDELGPPNVKDWSDDDTEPGDDEAFTPVFHRIINANDDGGEDDF
jgi:tetratricopeptide (TPR) repeat protein